MIPSVYGQLDINGVYVTTPNEGDREINNSFYCYWEMTVGYYLQDSGNLCGSGGTLFANPDPLPEVTLPEVTLPEVTLPSEPIDVNPFYMLILLVLIVIILLLTTRKKKQRKR